MSIDFFGFRAHSYAKGKFYVGFSYSDFRYQLKRKTIWSFRRAKHGWADPDTWGFDHYLAGVIAGGCRHLQDIAHGCPMELAHPDGFSENGMPIERTDGIDPFEEWKKILGQIAEGFEIYAKDEWWDPDNPNKDAEHEKIVLAKELFIKYYGNLWD